VVQVCKVFTDGRDFINEYNFHSNEIDHPSIVKATKAIVFDREYETEGT